MLAKQTEAEIKIAS